MTATVPHDPHPHPHDPARTAYPGTPSGFQATRRGLLIGASAFLTSRASDLLSARQAIAATEPVHMGFIDRLRLHWMDQALRRGWDATRDGATFGGISELSARETVAFARTRGWLGQPAKGSHGQG